MRLDFNANIVILVSLVKCVVVFGNITSASHPLITSLIKTANKVRGPHAKPIVPYSPSISLYDAKRYYQKFAAQYQRQKTSDKGKKISTKHPTAVQKRRKLGLPKKLRKTLRRGKPKRFLRGRRRLYSCRRCSIFGKRIVGYGRRNMHSGTGHRRPYWLVYRRNIARKPVVSGIKKPHVGIGKNKKNKAFEKAVKPNEFHGHPRESVIPLKKKGTAKQSKLLSKVTAQQGMPAQQPFGSFSSIASDALRNVLRLRNQNLAIPTHSIWDQTPVLQRFRPLSGIRNRLGGPRAISSSFPASIFGANKENGIGNLHVLGAQNTLPFDVNTPDHAARMLNILPGNIIPPSMNVPDNVAALNNPGSGTFGVKGVSLSVEAIPNNGPNDIREPLGDPLSADKQTDLKDLNNVLSMNNFQHANVDLINSNNNNDIRKDPSIIPSLNVIGDILHGDIGATKGSENPVATNSVDKLPVQHPGFQSHDSKVNDIPNDPEPFNAGDGFIIPDNNNKNQQHAVHMTEPVSLNDGVQSNLVDGINQNLVTNQPIGIVNDVDRIQTKAMQQPKDGFIEDVSVLSSSVDTKLPNEITNLNQNLPLESSIDSMILDQGVNKLDVSGTTIDNSITEMIPQESSLGITIPKDLPNNGDIVNDVSTEFLVPGEIFAGDGFVIPDKIMVDPVVPRLMKNGNGIRSVEPIVNIPDNFNGGFPGEGHTIDHSSNIQHHENTMNAQPKDNEPAANSNDGFINIVLENNNAIKQSVHINDHTNLNSDTNDVMRNDNHMHQTQHLDIVTEVKSIANVGTSNEHIQHHAIPSTTHDVHATHGPENKALPKDESTVGTFEKTSTPIEKNVGQFGESTDLASNIEVSVATARDEKLLHNNPSQNVFEANVGHDVPQADVPIIFKQTSVQNSDIAVTEQPVTDVGIPSPADIVRNLLNDAHSVEVIDLRTNPKITRENIVDLLNVNSVNDHEANVIHPENQALNEITRNGNNILNEASTSTHDHSHSTSSSHTENHSQTHEHPLHTTNLSSGERISHHVESGHATEQQGGHKPNKDATSNDSMKPIVAGTHTSHIADSLVVGHEPSHETGRQSMHSINELSAHVDSETHSGAHDLHNTLTLPKKDLSHVHQHTGHALANTEMHSSESRHSTQMMINSEQSSTHNDVNGMLLRFEDLIAELEPAHAQTNEGHSGSTVANTEIHSGEGHHNSQTMINSEQSSTHVTNNDVNDILLRFEDIIAGMEPAHTQTNGGHSDSSISVPTAQMTSSHTVETGVMSSSNGVAGHGLITNQEVHPHGHMVDTGVKSIPLVNNPDNVQHASVEAGVVPRNVEDLFGLLSASPSNKNILVSTDVLRNLVNAEMATTADISTISTIDNAHVNDVPFGANEAPMVAVDKTFGVPGDSSVKHGNNVGNAMTGATATLNEMTGVGRGISTTDKLNPNSIAGKPKVLRTIPGIMSSTIELADHAFGEEMSSGGETNLHTHHGIMSGNE